MTKGLGKTLLRLSPVRLLVRVVLTILHQAGRVASRAKLAALAPQAPDDCVVHWSVELKYPERIRWGRAVIVGPGCTLGAAGGIELGDHVHLSKGVLIETAGLDFTNPPPFPHKWAGIRLEDGVWLGAGAMVLAGVTVGAHAIIGAGAVVTRDVPPFTIVTGAGTRSRPRRPFSTGA